jgi:hypothetical protein
MGRVRTQTRGGGGRDTWNSGNGCTQKNPIQLCQKSSGHVVFSTLLRQTVRNLCCNLIPQRNPLGIVIIQWYRIRNCLIQKIVLGPDPHVRYIQYYRCSQCDRHNCPMCDTFDEIQPSKGRTEPADVRGRPSRWRHRGKYDMWHDSVVKTLLSSCMSVGVALTEHRDISYLTGNSCNYFYKSSSIETKVLVYYNGESERQREEMRWCRCYEGQSDES